MHVVIVTDRRDALHDFAQGLGRDVEWTDSAAGVLARATNPPWQLIVLDAMMPGLDYKAFLLDLLKVNAMLNTVVITDMDAEAFHHDSEGLGVLCAVPARPGRADGVRAMDLLCTLLGLW
jgi:DNA-binding response OmpR family regulator